MYVLCISEMEKAFCPPARLLMAFQGSKNRPEEEEEKKYSSYILKMDKCRNGMVEGRQGREGVGVGG